MHLRLVGLGAHWVGCNRIISGYLRFVFVPTTATRVRAFTCRKIDHVFYLCRISWKLDNSTHSCSFCLNLPSIVLSPLLKANVHILHSSHEMLLHVFNCGCLVCSVSKTFINGRTVINQYLVCGKLGQGSYGKVLLVIDVNTNIYYVRCVAWCGDSLESSSHALSKSQLGETIHLHTSLRGKCVFAGGTPNLCLLNWACHSVLLSKPECLKPIPCVQ